MMGLRFWVKVLGLGPDSRAQNTNMDHEAYPHSNQHGTPEKALRGP